MSFQQPGSEQRRNEMLKLFVNLGSLYVFVLRFADGRTRCDALRIRDDCFSDAAKAISWRNEIQREIMDCPDSLQHKNDAIEQLNYLYRMMTHATKSN